jgi:hypothetical protein
MIYTQPYSETARDLFTETDRIARDYGLLHAHKMVLPGVNNLTELEQADYTITVSPNRIIAESTQMKMLWDLDENTLSYELREEHGTVKSTTLYYEMIAGLNDYMLTKKEVIIPGKFSNGACFETVKTTRYLDYEACPENLPQGFSQGQQHSKTSLAIKIRPNPSTDMVQLTVPPSPHVSPLKIFDVSGNLILERPIHADQTQIEINIQEFPNGVYIAKVLQNNRMLSSKFVKQ